MKPARNKKRGEKRSLKWISHFSKLSTVSFLHYMRNLIKCFKGERQSSSQANYIWPFFLQGDKQTNRMLIIVSAWICTWKKKNIKFCLAKTIGKAVNSQELFSLSWLCYSFWCPKKHSLGTPSPSLIVGAELWAQASNSCQLHSDLHNWNPLGTEFSMISTGYILKNSAAKHPFDHRGKHWTCLITKGME